MLGHSTAFYLCRHSKYFGGQERGCVGDSVGRLVIISIVRKGHKENPEYSNGDCFDYVVNKLRRLVE